MTDRNRYLTGDPSAGGEVADLTAPTPPAAQSLASTATTASVTYTHPGAPDGTTYALTVTDEADASVTPDSGSGLGPYVFPVASDKAYRHTIRATGTDGQVADASGLVRVESDISADYPIESAAGWRTIKEWDFKAQGTQGPIPNGAGTITLDGESITTRGSTAGSGTFGTNNTCGLNASDGLYLECTTTASMLPEVTLTLPLGETLTAEQAMRVSLKIKVFNEDTNDSAAFYIADSSVTPTLDVSSALDVGGLRIYSQTGTLSYRRGAAASSGVTVPAGWANGTTLYVECIVPGYGNDMIVRVDDSGFLNASPDQRGRTQSGPASPTTTAATWAEGLSSIKLMLCVYNGGSGAGTPRATVESVKIEVR
jgi:hypothetical protein